MTPAQRDAPKDAVAGMPADGLLRLWLEVHHAQPDLLAETRGIDNVAFARAALALFGERLHQVDKDGSVFERRLAVGEYMLIADQELGEAQEAWIRNRSTYFALDELRQVAAVAMACFEQHGCPAR